MEEFHFNLAFWFVYSMSTPFRALETLKIAVVNDVYALAHWLSLAANLLHLEVSMDESRYPFGTKQPAIEDGDEGRITFTLAKLQTLNVPIILLQNFICPALKKFIMNSITWRTVDLIYFNGLRRTKRRSDPFARN